MDHGDVPQLLGYRGAGVLHRRLVLPRGHLQHVRALHGVEAGLAQVLHHRAGADRWPVHVREGIQHLGALLLLLHPGQQTVGRDVGHRRHRDSRRHQSARKRLADIHSGDGVLALRIDLPKGAAQPALGPDLVRLARVPDVHRPEVRARRVLVTDTVYDRHVAALVDVLHRPHGRVHAQLVVYLDDAVLGDLKSRPRVVVVPVGVRNHRVEVVVAPGQLEHDEDWVFLFGGHFDALLRGAFLSRPSRTGTLSWPRSAPASRRRGARSPRGPRTSRQAPPRSYALSARFACSRSAPPGRVCPGTGR